MSDIIRFCNKHGETEFYYNKKYDKYVCKKCNQESVDERRRRKKEELVKYKGGKCEICGYDKCIDALEFHHVDSSKKSFNIGNSISKSLELLKEEADKCILVCSNCHREIHSKENEENRNNKLEQTERFYNTNRKLKPIERIDKDFVIDLLKDGVKKTDIANKIGVSVSTLTRFFEKNGINMVRSTISIEESVEPTEKELYDLRKNGYSFSKIGRMFHHGRNYISTLCKKYNIK